MSLYLLSVQNTYQCLANLESDRDYFFGEISSKSCIFEGYFDVVETFPTERSEGQI